jgi:hypothetical protein
MRKVDMVQATTIALVLTLCSIFAPISSKAQFKYVKLKFEVDGKEIVNPKFKILIYDGNEIIEPRTFGEGFIVPPTVNLNKEVAVRFISGKYDLFFEHVNDFDFKSDWKIGINNFPDPQDGPSSAPPDKKLTTIFYLEFTPQDTEGTVLTVYVYK